jgi:hypothetical protein
LDFLEAGNISVPVLVDINNVRDLNYSLNGPQETKNGTNTNMCKQIGIPRHDHNDKNVLEIQQDVSNCTKEDQFCLDTKENRTHSGNEAVQDRLKVFTNKNDIDSEFQSIKELENGSTCKNKSNISNVIRGCNPNKSISLDRLEVTHTGVQQLPPKEENKYSNGKCSMISSGAHVNKSLNDDIQKTGLLVCHEEEPDDFKMENDYGRSNYRTSLNSTENVNRSRKRSFMNLSNRCHVPKAVQISSETKKETKLARISLCIVWLFIFCHVWKLIPTAYETFFTEDMGVGLNIEWPYWLTFVKEISHSLITINSGLNFLIYIVL